MAGLASTDVTVKGDGLNFNVRSYKLERLIELDKVALVGDADTPTYYEIGDIPAGFVPRNVAIVEIKKYATPVGGSAPKVGVYLKGDSTKVVERTLGSAEGLTVGQLTGKNLTGAGETVCIAATAALTNGVIKIVLSGDMMTDVWDDGLGRDAFDPAEAIQHNMG